jgi:predicted dehydrogenase
VRDSVEVGIVGAGNVLPAYLQVLDRLVARGQAREGVVCARRREAWESLLARRPGLRLVAQAEEVAQSDADVVVVITPPESHAELTRLALEHGKHVVAEKPLAPTRAAAEPLFELAARNGLHLVAAPFVQLAPTFRALWGELQAGAIGRIHSARGLYGNAGSHWASWYHAGGVGPLAEAGIYNLKSLTAVLGPVVEVLAAEAIAVETREVEGKTIASPDADVSHVILRHEGGALSSVVSSQAVQRYRRPGLEFYGTEGTANLLGDDWDPHGYEIWRNDAGRWEEYEAIDPTWLWADGLREIVLAVREDRAPLADPAHDLHVLDIVEAARQAASERAAATVSSRFGPLDLHPDEAAGRRDRHHLHDHTRPPDEQ